MPLYHPGWISVMSFYQICQTKGSLQMVQKAPAQILNISDLFWPDCTGSHCRSKLVSRCFLLTYKLVNGHATNVCLLVRFSLSGAATFKCPEGKEEFSAEQVFSSQCRTNVVEESSKGH